MMKTEQKGGKRKLAVKPIQNKLRRQANTVERVAKKHTRVFFANRVDNLRKSRKNVMSWLIVVVALAAIVLVQSLFLSDRYQTTTPSTGGSYAEGVIGEISTINPLFAQTEPEMATSQLVYGGLLRFDSSNRLRGEIAKSFSISDDGLIYDVKLRQNVKWQDTDINVSADDVIYTLDLIKSTQVASPLYSTWRNVKVEKTDKYAIRFTLRSPISPFPQALTFGILPKHELESVSFTDIREHISENMIIGSGPYKYRLTTGLNGEKTLSFASNEQYFRSAPKIKNFYIKTYPNSEKMLAGISNGDINGAVGLMDRDASKLVQQKDGFILPVPLDSGVYTIFNNERPIVNSKSVRSALRLATDRTALIDAVASGGLSRPSELNSPIAKGIFESIDVMKQPGYDPSAAMSTLDASGWLVGKDGIREKDGQRLELNMVTVKESDYEPIANLIAEQWRKVGVDTKLTLAETSNVQQNHLVPRAYDVLIYQLQLGADPDVYAYWHSSNVKPQRLNLANYKSAVADLALFGGRTVSESQREAKYITFVETWLEDAPAIALYRPNLNYWHSDGVVSLSKSPLSDEMDRFRQVYNWSVETETVYNTP